MSGEAVRWQGLDLVLLPERAVHLPGAAALVVADLHLGKGAAFRAAGIPVPEGPARDDLDRLAGLLARTRASTLVVLGDLLHAREGRTPDVLDRLGRWRAGHASVQVMVVRGNHDRTAGDPPDELGFTVDDGPLPWAGVELRHEPPGEDARLPVLCGHLHPVVVLRGGGDRLRAPCFWDRGGHLVLPAFGTFTGGGLVRPRAGDRVWAVGPGVVRPVALA